MSDRSSVQKKKASTNGSDLPAAPAEVEAAGWTPTMSMIVAVVVAFFAGLFVGQELLHQPQVTVAPAASAPADPGNMAPGAAASSPDAAASTDAAAGDENSSVPLSPVEVAALKKAIASENDPNRLIQLAEFHVQRQPDVAVAAFLKAIRLGAHSSQVYRGLAVAYLALHEIAKAESNLRLALHVDPKDVTSHVALALTLEKKPGAEAESRAEFRKALALNPPEALKSSIQAELSRLQASSGRSAG